MSFFETYLKLGFHHILDVTAFDHILFLIALCAPYAIQHWKQLLILITAFTIGHSLSLLLAALNVVNIDQDIVEVIIAITIGITALQNVIIPKPEKNSMRLRYITPLLFGMVHGLGFSSYFKAIAGKDDNFILMLLSFNLGIELGQIIIVLAIVLLFLAAEKLMKVKIRDRNLFLSGLSLGISLFILFWH